MNPALRNLEENKGTEKLIQNAYWFLLLRIRENLIHRRACPNGTSYPPKFLPNSGQPSDYRDPSKALCHCSSCRHYTSSIYSHNIVVPSSDFTILSGTLKEISKMADSGKTITNAFCPECGKSPYLCSFCFKLSLLICMAG